MKVSSINNHSFKANEQNSQKKENSKKTYLIYPLAQGLGAIGGYSIPLKMIDGPDVASGERGGMLVKMKTKVPNKIGKWKNALAGAFAATGLVMIYDYIESKKNSTT